MIVSASLFFNDSVSLTYVFCLYKAFLYKWDYPFFLPEAEAVTCDKVPSVASLQ